MKTNNAVRSIFLALLGVTTPTSVLAIDWIDATGGDFNDSSNWNGGVPPSATDTAVFNVGALPASPYTVNLVQNEASSELVIRNDSVNLDLGGFTYDLAGGTLWSMSVGSSGTELARLNVSNGALTSASSGAAVDGFAIGDAAGANGALTFSNVTWNGTGDVRVGRFGTGALTANNSTITTTGNVLIADRDGSNGNFVLDNTGWSHTGEVRVGASGVGSFTVRNGATMSNGFAVVENQFGAASEGTVLVTGSGSSWTSSILSVAGDLIVQDSGTVTSNGNMFSSSAAGETATITVSNAGSELVVNGAEFHVGSRGTVQFGVTGGGTATTGTTFIGAGRNTSTGTFGTGHATVAGVGSAWNNSGSVSVGSLGAGTLTISGGGTVTNGAASIGIGSSSPGAAPQASGSVVVEGAGSQWTSNGVLTVAGWGTGDLTIRDGASVSSQQAHVASGVGGGGATVSVEGTGSSWSYGSSLGIGSTGTGLVAVQNGASASGGAVQNGTNGTIRVADASLTATTITNSGTLELQNASVTGNITNGNEIDVAGASPTVVSGNLENNGNIKTTGTTFQVTGLFTNNGTYVSDPSDNLLADVVIGTGGVLMGGAGDRFFVSGDFTNNSTQTSTWDTLDASLILNGSGLQNIALGSEDLGSAGGVNNFGWGSLTIGSGVNISFFDEDGGGAAVYARDLILFDGLSQLSSISSPFSIYYDPLSSANGYLNGQTYSLAGGGSLSPGAFPSAVPVPAAAWLFGSGLVGLIGFARRKSR